MTEVLEEFRALFDAAVALGDPVVPPVGTRVRVRTKFVVDMGKDGDLEGSGFFEGTIAPVHAPGKARVLLSSVAGTRVERPTVLEVLPRDLSIVDFPAGAVLPFGHWLRLDGVEP